MPYTAMQRIVGVALLACCTAIAAAAPTAGRKPPRHIIDPVAGLRVPATADLAAAPATLLTRCNRTPADNTSTAHLWIFAHASNAGTDYYVLSGYAELRQKPTQAPRFAAIERGGLYVIANGKCVSDPADEYFATPDDDVPLSILQMLARDATRRLIRAFGDADKLRAEFQRQRIDVEALPPVVQAEFRPYVID